MTRASNSPKTTALNPAHNGGPVESNDLHSLDDFSQLWRLAFNASPDMISVLDNDHRIVAVNTAMAKAMACTPELAVGRRCYDLVHQSDKPPVACPHHALMKDGQAHQSEIFEERLNAWLQVSVTPLYSKDKQLIGSIHIARDITQQKRADQALRESEERYHHLSEATMEGVMLSKNARIIAANQVLADMIGYSIEEITQMTIADFVVPEERDRLMQAVQKNPEGVHFFDCRRRDGTVFPIEAHARSVRYKGGTVYQTAVRDLTEQKRMEQERARHERLQGVLEMAGAVCHEISQPLMALQGFLDILASRIEPNRTVNEKIERMTDQIERITVLTQKLMKIAKYTTKEYAGGEKIIDIDQSVPEDEASDDVPEDMEISGTHDRR